MWECEWWQNFKTNEKFKNHIRSNFPYKRPLSNDSLLGKIRDGSLYGYIPCDLVVSPELKANISYFAPFFKKTLKLEEITLENICKIMPLKMIFLSIPSEC